MVRRQEESFTAKAGFVGLVPEDEWWVAEFSPNHPTLTVYVNIGTPPEWTGSRVTQIDLDLDVIRRRNGTVMVLDEDEFEEEPGRVRVPG